MVIAIVMLSSIAVLAILLVGRNHLHAAAPNVEQLLRSRWRAPVLGPLFVEQPTATLPPHRVRSVHESEPPATKSWSLQLALDRDEDHMLSALRTRPSDELLRMVYADWLEDRGAVARAAFVRGSDMLAEQEHVVDTTTVAWRAVINHERVSCCGLTWDRCEPIEDDELARRCVKCGKVARYIADLALVSACHKRGEIPVIDVSFLVSRPARPTALPFDLSSL